MERADGGGPDDGGGRSGGRDARHIGDDALVLLAGGGAGLSQADIIQEQALTIAELEDKLARAAEYKALTKVKLKEAAQRLREYRLRADALVAELETVKRSVAGAETEPKTRDKRRRPTRTVAVQTVDASKKMVNCGSQTTIAGSIQASCARGCDQGVQTEREVEEAGPLELLLEQATVDEHTRSLLRPVAFDSATLPTLELSFPDVTSAVIDAELAMDDSDDELAVAPTQSASHTMLSSPSNPSKVNFDDEISSVIDKELEMSSEEEQQMSLRLTNAAAAAVDAELATSDSDEEQERLASADGHTKPKAVESHTRADLLKAIDDEIDAELASSSDEEVEAPRSVQIRDARTPEKGVGSKSDCLPSSSSKSDSSDDSSDGSSDDDAKAMNGDNAGEGVEAAAAREPSRASGDQSCVVGETSTEPLGSTQSSEASALAIALRKAIDTDERAEIGTIDESRGNSNHQPSSPAIEPGEIKETRQVNTILDPAVRGDELTRDGAQAASSSRKRGIDDLNDATTTAVEAGESGIKKSKLVGDEPLGPESLDESILPDAARSSEHDAEASRDQLRRSSAQASQTTKKRDLYLLKARQSFKREIMRVDGEELDERYLGRTFAALVRCSATFFESHPQHVVSLCTAITKLYRDNNVSPMLALQGALRVFRTPRTRNVLKNESMRLSELCQRVLLQLMSPPNPEAQGISIHSSAYWGLNQCLDVLRGLMMDGTPPLENVAAEAADAVSKIRVATRTESGTASHEKGFLIHVCALHAQLCRASGMLHRSRVFLFDVIRCNTNIKGLQLAATMVEISPELLTTDLDEKFRDRQMILKDTILHVLVAITGIASTQQQRIFNKSSVEVMRGISMAIQREDLDELNGAHPEFQRDFIKNLSCQVFTAPTAVMANAEASFQVGKSLELLAAFYGTSYLTVDFPLSRFRELFLKHDADGSCVGKKWITTICGYCTAAIASCQDQEALKYVQEILEWFGDLLSVSSSTEESRDWQLPCATACVDIALNASLAEVNTRRQGVRMVLVWFDQQPTEWLMQLPALFVRRLRSAVLSTRPPCSLRRATRTS